MVAVCGGPQAAANRAVQPVSQGQLPGRCRTCFRAEVEMRAGIWISLRRIVPVRSLPRVLLARVPAARARLNALSTVPHPSFGFKSGL